MAEMGNEFSVHAYIYNTLFRPHVSYLLTFCWYGMWGGQVRSSFYCDQMHASCAHRKLRCSTSLQVTWCSLQYAACIVHNVPRCCLDAECCVLNVLSCWTRKGCIVASSSIIRTGQILSAAERTYQSHLAPSTPLAANRISVTRAPLLGS
jgi:hypothetical protein